MNIMFLLKTSKDNSFAWVTNCNHTFFFRHINANSGYNGVILQKDTLPEVLFTGIRRYSLPIQLALLYECTDMLR